MADLGRLVVNLEANIARFTSDMSRASQQTTQAMTQINSAISSVKNGLAALGVGVSVAGFVAIIKGSIDAADNLRDMSQKTGVAVETLNGLGFAAGQAGGSLESMVGASGKLNKSIAEAAGGTGESAEAFKALGISVKDAQGNLKTADVVMAEVADKFEKYQDGPQKAALALRLFGKAGADMIPLLNEGGAALRENVEYAKRYSGATAELSNMSDNFNDTLGKLALQQRGFINQLNAEMLPVLQSVANAFLGAAEKANELHSWSGKLSTALTGLTGVAVTGAFVFEQWGIKIGAAAAKAQALKNFDFKGIGVIGAASTEDLEKSRTDYEKLRNEIRNGGAKDRFAKVVGMVETNISQEGEVLASRNQMIAKYQSEGVISVKDAATAKTAAQADYVKNMKGLYDQEIYILTKAKEYAKSPEDAAAAQAKIDAVAKAQSLLTNPKPAAPSLPNGEGDKTARALLAGQVKDMENAYAQARAIASFQGEYMSELRAQDLVDVQTYEQFKLAAIASSAAAAVKHYDAEIAALTKARDTTSDATAKVQIDGQIKEKVAQKEKARVDAVNQTSLALLGQGAAQAELNKQLQGWSRQQDSALAQQKLANDLHGATTVEIIRQTAALRAQQEAEEAIRRAKERGSISSQAEAEYGSKVKAAADEASKQNIRGAGLGVIDSLKRPDEAENKEHEDRLATLNAYRAQEFADTVAANEALRRETERHELAMTQIKADQEMERLSLAGGSADQIYNLLKQAGMEQTALGKAAFLVSKAIAVAEIIMNTEVAAAKAQAQFGVYGIPIAMAIRGAGYASAGIVAGLAIAEASAEGGYDIPAGKNPVTQLHEKEMVLPKAQADVIRGLAANGGGTGGDFKLTLVSNGTPQRVVQTTKVSNDEWAMIVEDAVSATAASLYEVNSKTSRALSRNFNVPRSR